MFSRTEERRKVWSQPLHFISASYCLCKTRQTTSTKTSWNNIKNKKPIQPKIISRMLFGASILKSLQINPDALCAYQHSPFIGPIRWLEEPPHNRPLRYVRTHACTGTHVWPVAQCARGVCVCMRALWNRVIWAPVLTLRAWCRGCVWARRSEPRWRQNPFCLSLSLGAVQWRPRGARLSLAPLEAKGLLLLQVRGHLLDHHRPHQQPVAPSAMIEERGAPSYIQDI